MKHPDIVALAGLPYEEIALRVMQPFVGDSFSNEDLGDAIQTAYSGFGHAARAPLVQLGPNHHLLELFHGPTLAFKDFAMQLIGQLFQKALSRHNKQVTIVGATSGDTGSAAIEAFRGLDAANVFILFPRRPRFRCAAPTDDDTNRVKCPCNCDGGYIRYLPSNVKRHV